MFRRVREGGEKEQGLGKKAVDKREERKKDKGAGLGEARARNGGQLRVRQFG